MRTKRQKGVFAPSDNQNQLIAFIDELNMPIPQKYGAIPVLELLRQLVDEQGWYNVETQQWMRFEDINLIASMVPRNIPSQRLLRHFIMLNFDGFCLNSQRVIFTQILNNHFVKFKFPEYIKQIDSLIAEATIELLSEVKKSHNLVPSPKKMHYNVGLRDLLQVISGVCLARPKSSYLEIDIIKIWIHECNRVFRDRLVEKEDEEAFDLIIEKIIQTQYLEDQMKAMKYFFTKMNNSILKDFGQGDPNSQKAKNQKEKAAEFQFREDDERKNYNDLIKHLFDNENQTSSQSPLTAKELIFTNLIEVWKHDQRIFEEFTEIDKISVFKQFLEQSLESYNIHNKIQLQPIFFQDAITKSNSILRLLSRENGHGLLIGEGGSGRQPLTKLASFILGAQFVLFQHFNPTQWRDSLRQYIIAAGGEKRKIIFYINQQKINSNLVLEDISQIFATGEIPNMFTQDQKSQIVDTYQGLGKQNPNDADQDESDKEEQDQDQDKHQKKTANDASNEDPNNNDSYQDKRQIWVNKIFQKFIRNVKTNLHILLAMSPNDERFRYRLRQYPSMQSHTSIIWFTDWPAQAYSETARVLIDKDLPIFQNQQTTYQIGNLLVSSHLFFLQHCQNLLVHQKRHLFITPIHFQRLVRQLNRLLEKLEGNNQELMQRYRRGVERIFTTDIQLNKMRIQLESLNNELQQKTKENLILLEKVKAQQTEADGQKEICAAEEEKCRIQQEEAQALQKECNADLQRVLPLLEESTQALQKITKDDLTQLQSYSYPPEPVRLVMEALCMVLGVDHKASQKPVDPLNPYGECYYDYWEYSQKYLLNEKLLKIFRDFQEDRIRQIQPQKYQKLLKLLKEPALDQKSVFNCSSAAGNLSLWIRAVLFMNDILIMVDPQRTKLNRAEISLKQANLLLEEKVQILEENLAQIQILRAQYDEAAIEKEKLRKNFELVQTQLNRSEKLLSGLATEKQNWVIKERDCQENVKTALGDTILSSIIITYFGMFPTSYRQIAMEEIQKIIKKGDIRVNKQYSLSNFLCDPITISRWVSKENLPNDAFSIENAIIMKNDNCWPMCIDPQSQGVTWIKQMERFNGLQIITPSMNAAEIFLIIQSAMQQAFPVLMQSCGEQINPSFLQPLVYKNWEKSGQYFKILMNEQTIDCSQNFRFYMTTKLNRPKFSSEFSFKVVLLDFSLTQQALTDQLLNKILAIEKPEEQSLRIKNINSIFQNQVNMDQIQRNILELISTYTGDDLLNDEQLIEALQNSRRESESMQTQTNQLNSDQSLYELTRNYYREVSKVVADVYFIISDMSIIDQMYQFSLEWFTKIFQEAVRISSVHKLKPINLFTNIQTLNFKIQNFDVINEEERIAREIEKENEIKTNFINSRRAGVSAGYEDLQQIKITIEQFNQEKKSMLIAQTSSEDENNSSELGSRLASDNQKQILPGRELTRKQRELEKEMNIFNQLGKEFEIKPNLQNSGPVDSEGLLENKNLPDSNSQMLHLMLDENMSFKSSLTQSDFQKGGFTPLSQLGSMRKLQMSSDQQIPGINEDQKILEWNQIKEQEHDSIKGEQDLKSESSIISRKPSSENFDDDVSSQEKKIRLQMKQNQIKENNMLKERQEAVRLEQQKLEENIQSIFSSYHAQNYIKVIIKTFNLLLYNNICSSLVESDKLLFSFIICLKMMLVQKTLKLRDLKFFCKGNFSKDEEDEEHEEQLKMKEEQLKKNQALLDQAENKTKRIQQKETNQAETKAPMSIDYNFSLLSLKEQRGQLTEKNPLILWLTDTQWEGLKNFCLKIITDQELTQDMLNLIYTNPLMFEKLFRENTFVASLTAPIFSPQISQIINSSCFEKLTFFERLILVRILRTDQISQGINNIILQELGQEFLNPPSLDIEKQFKESTNLTPIMYIIQTGIDVLKPIQFLAHQNNINIHLISLGQGQQMKAEKALEEGMRQGMWVILQNCHLSPSFIPILQRAYDNIANKRVAENYRLWLTTHFTTIISNSLLQNSIQYRVEQPQGVKSIMKQIYVNLKTEKRFFDMQQANPSMWQRFFFSMCFFHAIVQERNKFGQLGWNRVYQFTLSDLTISLHNISLFMEKNIIENSIPWTTIKYLVTEIIYGGKITEENDLKLVQTIFGHYVRPEIFKSYQLISGIPEFPTPGFTREGNFLVDQLNAIEQFPYQDPCQLFNMHQNAEVSGIIASSNDLLTQFISIFPKESDESIISQQEQRTSLIHKNSTINMAAGNLGQKNKKTVSNVEQNAELTADYFLSMLPEAFNQAEILQKFPHSYNQCLNIFFYHEIVKYNQLIEVVKNTLIELKNAVSGIGTVTEQIEEILNNFYVATIPIQWKNLSYQSFQPLFSWFTDFVDRLMYLESWKTNGIPNQFWISVFYYPQGLFTAMKLNYSRQNEIPINQMFFQFLITNARQMKVRNSKNLEKQQQLLKQSTTLHEQSLQGFTIYGLFLQGAKWDISEGYLADPTPGVLIDQMPDIIVYHKHISNKDNFDELQYSSKVQNENLNQFLFKPFLSKPFFQYLCPVYQTTQRYSSQNNEKSWIIDIDLPIKQNEDMVFKDFDYKGEEFWAIRGVAMITTVDQ